MKKAGIIAIVVSGLGVLLIVGLCLVLGVGVFFFTSRQKTESIVAVINENNQAAEEMQAAVKSPPAGMGGNQALAMELPRMVVRLRAIDTGKCPADFQDAFRRYVEAWDGLSRKYAALPQTDAEILAAGIGALLSGNSNQAEAQGDAVTAQAQALHQAWDDVVSVAAKYNVTVK